MSYAGDVRDKVEALALKNKTKPFEGRELELVIMIMDSFEVNWDEEFRTDAKWWGNDVVEFVNGFLVRR